jgi:phosphatidylinositol alpha-1,6-mannosyltransferase
MLVQDKGVPPTIITVVGNGVHAGLLTAAPRAEDAQHQRIAGDGPVILTLARLDERYKGHDMMLQALPLIRARVPDVTYVIAGDGRYRHYYQRVATALGVGDHVVFTGRVTDEDRLVLYDRCDLFALISREAPDGGCEGFGIVFLEAAARGKPAVGGRSGGVPDAIVDGVTGLLVEPTDVEAIAGACVRLLTDRDLARRMGCSGRERVQASFTWGHIAQQVEGILLHSVGHCAGGTAGA